MKNATIRILTAMALVCCVSMSTAAAEHVIAVQASHKAGEVNRSTIRKVMSGAKATLHGKKVVLVLLPKGSPEMKWICREVLGFSEDIYRRVIARAYFQGRIPKPLQARGFEDALRLISEHPGALAPMASGSLTSDTKAIYP